MKKIIMLLSLTIITTSFMHAICKKPDKGHVDPNIVHCPYTQEDINRCYCKKGTCYTDFQKRNECFFCSCPKSEHTTKEIPKKQKKRRRIY